VRYPLSVELIEFIGYKNPASRCAYSYVRMTLFEEFSRFRQGSCCRGAGARATLSHRWMPAGTPVTQNATLPRRE